MLVPHPHAPMMAFVPRATGDVFHDAALTSTAVLVGVLPLDVPLWIKMTLLMLTTGLWTSTLTEWVQPTTDHQGVDSQSDAEWALRFTEGLPML